MSKHVFKVSRIDTSMKHATANSLNSMKTTPIATKWLFTALLGLTLTACQDEVNQPAPTFPERLAFVSERLYPEGIAYSPQLGQFLVSSLTQGKIGTVDMNGTYADFVSDPLLIGAVGLEVSNGKLYVCNGDQGVSTKSTAQSPRMTAGLFIFDIATKRLDRQVNLATLTPAGQMHFANDVAVDAQGNAYVTDSFSPIIYKVTPAGVASIFLTDPRFSNPGFGLNGIVFHPNGYLLVANTGAARVYKVDLMNGNAISEVAGIAVGGDGMQLIGNDLYIVNGGSQVSQFRSADNFQTTSLIKVDAAGYMQATTNAEANGQMYTLNARIGEVGAAMGNAALLQARDYSIVRFK